MFAVCKHVLAVIEVLTCTYTRRSRQLGQAMLLVKIIINQTTKK